MHELAVHDRAHGSMKVVLDRANGLLTLRGEQVPEIVISRSGDAATDLPGIGSRDRAALHLLVGGAIARIEPAVGRISKRLLVVEVEYAGTVLHIRPDSASTNEVTILDDGQESTLGEIYARDSALTTVWNTPVGPATAALAYAVTAALGLGTENVLPALLHTTVLGQA